MPDDLEGAIRAADWPAALLLALEAWREHRGPDLAALIDAIGANLPPVPAPRSNELHEWWMQRADPYDPLAVSALVEHASARITHADRNPEQPGKIPRGLDGARELSAALAAITSVGHVHHANAIERLAAIMAWPPDPRAATILLDWLVAMPVRWDPVTTRRATLHFYGAVADQLKVLADTHHLARLAECERTPRGPTATLRKQQTVLAIQIRAAIEKRRRPSAEILERVAACTSLLASEPPMPARTRDIDEATLWRECARQRGDPAPRLVLADFLVERGDSRGELIALQCADTPKARTAATKLLRANWNAWLGDLALVLNRSGTELVGGMLEVVRVGIPKSPDWAFGKPHRELATVHTVRPGHVTPERYARFLATPGLAPDRIAIDAPEIIAFMAAARKQWTFRALEYGHYSVRDGYRYEFPPIVDTFSAIARLVPALEEIRIDPLQWPQDAYPQLLAVVPKLPAMFPTLKKIALDRQWIDDDAAFAAMPLVTVA